MKVLIVGGGASVLALTKTLLASPQHPDVYCCSDTTHPELQRLTTQFVLLSFDHVQTMVDLAIKWGIDMAIISSEIALGAGLADALWDVKVPTLGPIKALAQIETDPKFVRELMRKYEIPGECNIKNPMGQHYTLQFLSDGNVMVPMPLVAVHEGVGSYSEASHNLPFLSQFNYEKSLSIVEGVISGLTARYHQRYVGMVTARFILMTKGVYLLGFKARLGEPEALNVLALLTSDLVEIFYEMTLGKLKPSHVSFAQKATACKCSVVALADSIAEADQKVDSLIQQL